MTIRPRATVCENWIPWAGESTPATPLCSLATFPDDRECSNTQSRAIFLLTLNFVSGWQSPTTSRISFAASRPSRGPRVRPSVPPASRHTKRARRHGRQDPRLRGGAGASHDDPPTGEPSAHTRNEPGNGEASVPHLRYVRRMGPLSAVVLPAERRPRADRGARPGGLPGDQERRTAAGGERGGGRRNHRDSFRTARASGDDLSPRVPLFCSRSLYA